MKQSRDIAHKRMENCVHLVTSVCTETRDEVEDSRFGGKQWTKLSLHIGKTL
jgi:hypothetical protein